MKKILFLLLAALTLCCCEKESDTTGKLVIKLHSNDDRLPMNLIVRILETNDTILDAQITKKESSYRLNPGNYKFVIIPSNTSWRYTETFQIVGGKTVTFTTSNVGNSLVTN